MPTAFHTKNHSRGGQHIVQSKEITKGQFKSFADVTAAKKLVSTLKKDFKKMIMEHLDQSDVKVEFENNTRVKLDMPGNELKKVLSSLDKVMHLFFEKDTDKYND